MFYAHFIFIFIYNWHCITTLRPGEGTEDKEYLPVLPEKTESSALFPHNEKQDLKV